MRTLISVFIAVNMLFPVTASAQFAAQQLSDAANVESPASADMAGIIPVPAETAFSTQSTESSNISIPEGDSVPFIIMRNMLGSKYYWNSGTGTGSEYYWRSGTGPGSEYYWKSGTGPGSEYYWRSGSGPGSEYYWKSGSGPGSEYYWKSGSGPGSEYYWKSGSGPGSEYYWRSGSGPGPKIW